MIDSPEIATESLTPCPFCGSSSWSFSWPVEDEEEIVIVHCNDCLAEGPWLGVNDSQSMTEALAAWDKRAPAPVIALHEARIQGRREGLEAAVGVMRGYRNYWSEKSMRILGRPAAAANSIIDAIRAIDPETLEVKL